MCLLQTVGLLVYHMKWFRNAKMLTDGGFILVVLLFLHFVRLLRLIRKVKKMLKAGWLGSAKCLEIWISLIIPVLSSSKLNQIMIRIWTQECINILRILRHMGDRTKYAIIVTSATISSLRCDENMRYDVTFAS